MNQHSNPNWEEDLDSSEIFIAVVDPDFEGSPGEDMLIRAIGQQKPIILMLEPFCFTPTILHHYQGKKQVIRLPEPGKPADGDLKDLIIATCEGWGFHRKDYDGLTKHDWNYRTMDKDRKEGFDL